MHEEDVEVAASAHLQESGIRPPRRGMRRVGIMIIVMLLLAVPLFDLARSARSWLREGLCGSAPIQDLQVAREALLRSQQALVAQRYDCGGDSTDENFVSATYSSSFDCDRASRELAGLYRKELHPYSPAAASHTSYGGDYVSVDGYRIYIACSDGELTLAKARP